MADNNLSTLLRVDVNDFPKDQNPSNSERRVIWHPLEHMNGHIVIKSLRLLDIEKISVHFEGLSRVWTQALTGDNQILIRTSSYKFLHQTHDMTATESLHVSDREGFTYVASFRLVIPRWAILKTDGVPDQCLSLPPSLSAGVPYRFPGEDCEYAQPSIIYRLRARVQLNSQQDLIFPAGAEASKTITILPYAPPMPPTDTSDFPAEFISSASNTYRIFLVGSLYLMTLSMVEPAAICLQDTQTRGSVTAMIHVKIKASGSVMDATSVKKVRHSLKDLLFKTQPLLRVKTFYSTEPFRKLPGQTMLSLNGPMRLKDQVVKLQEQDLKASSWQQDRPDESSSFADVDRRSKTSAKSANVSTVGSGKEFGAPFSAEDSSKSWWTHLSMPIAVLPNLPPTFCSVTASRQYSVITRIRVGGIRIKEFVLEVPLQIVYAPKGGQEQSSTFSTQKLQPSFRSTSQLEEMLHEMDHPDEDLPGYS